MSISVAVIGGGISGLACAQYIKAVNKSVRVTVFDTGKHAPGGRCSSREYERTDGRTYIFDHAVQCFTASSAIFRDQVKMWIGDGIVRKWPSNRIGTFNHGKFVPLERNVDIFVGSKGARSIAKKMAQGLDVERPVWVSKICRVGEKWHLYNYDRLLGQFSHIVIAHNGKCADNLTRDAKIPKINNLLKARFGAKIPERFSGGGQMQLCSLWILLVVFPRSLDVSFEGAFVEGSPVLSWIANNTEKLKTHLESKGHECWTVISTREFGASHKVPQENIPSKTKDVVTNALLTAFHALINTPVFPKPMFTNVQLWGAAVPLNTLGEPCVYQPSTKVGICGDWLLEPSIEGAYISGVEMGKVILKEFDRPMSDIGLDCRLTRFDTKAIGRFDLSTKQDFMQTVMPSREKCVLEEEVIKVNGDEHGDLKSRKSDDVTKLSKELEQLCLRRQEVMGTRNLNAKRRVNRKIREVALQLNQLGVQGMDKYIAS